jgi:hypothetical protein
VLLSSCCPYAVGGTVYDYQVFLSKGDRGSEGAMVCELRPWLESVPAFAYRKETPFLQVSVILVETLLSSCSPLPVDETRTQAPCFFFCVTNSIQGAHTLAAVSLCTQILVPTVDTVSYAALLELCVSASRPVLLTGATGVGKSVMVQAALRALSDPAARGHTGARTTAKGGASTAPKVWGAAALGAKEVEAHTIAFTAQTGSLEMQLLIEDKLEKKRKSRWDQQQGLGGRLGR